MGNVMAPGLQFKVGENSSWEQIKIRGRKVEDDYTAGEYLGRGGFGYVTEVIHKISGERMACKIIPLNQADNEIRIWSEISGHRNILPLTSVYRDQNSNLAYLITDLCSGGSLCDMMQMDGLFCEKEAAMIMKRLVEALQYCHDKGIIHRDVKIDNILIPSKIAFHSFPDIKLADFGCSTHFSEGRKLKSS
jgi:calcium-dependent protein kinase